MQKVLSRKLIGDLSVRQLLLPGLAVLSVLVALLAIFVLSSWAEAAAWHHATQHVLIFLAGLGVGSTVALQLPSKRGES